MTPTAHARSIPARLVICALLLLNNVHALLADFPYPSPPSGVDPYSYHRYMFRPLNSPLPNDFSGGDYWKLTSDRSPYAVRYSQQELFGVMGASVDKAWEISTGRPDVVIAILDSGIIWQEAQPDLFNKLYLNRGELPMPAGASAYDANHDGVFNIKDYAGDSRVYDANGNGRLDPEDLILIFSDRIDTDGNGYIDDICGWDFFENDNNPRDDVFHGHGTNRMFNAAAEANNGGAIGTAPNSMILPVRVGDTFMVETNEFAQGVVFAVDSGARIIGEALGALNNTRFAREAVDYAYRRGVTIVGSAGDEQSQRSNFPARYGHVIMVNSVTKYSENGNFDQLPRSFLYLNGCTNFGSRIDIAVPTESCSSEASGKSSGMAALTYATALNEIAKGELKPYPGTNWALSPNEMRQIMTMTADDVDFETPIPNYQTIAILPSQRYRSRPGWDPYFGAGRVNALSMVQAVDHGHIPPEADITSPDWFDVVNPNTGKLTISGRVAALRASSFSYTVEVATSANPGTNYTVVYRSGERHGAFEGTLATIDLKWLSELMPNGVSGPLLGADGKTDSNRFTFIVRVRVTDSFKRTGEARLSLFLHSDPDVMPGFPKRLAGDGVGSPVFADINKDGINELVFATSEGQLHAMEPDGAELRGWPVTTTVVPLTVGAASYRTGEIHLPVYSPIMMGAPAIGDLDGDGTLEIVAADMEGKVHVWEPNGTRRTGFPVSTNRAYSSVFRPNGQYHRNPDNRMDWGIASQPALGDLNQDGKLEIVVGALDMHVYAWQADGTQLSGWPVYLRSPEKVAYVEPGTHFTELVSTAAAYPGTYILATPSIGDITGDGVPEVIIGTTEEYLEPINAGIDKDTLETLNEAYRLSKGNAGFSVPSGNGRLYAIWADGTMHDHNSSDNDGLDPDAFVPGWPVRLAQIYLDVLPALGAGVNMPAVLADVDHDGDLEIGISSVAGFYYIFQGNGISFYGRDAAGNDIPLPITPLSYGGNSNTSDSPAFAVMGGGIFADLGAGITLIGPTVGLFRVADLLLPANQLFSEAQISAWNLTTVRFEPGFPHQVADFEFLTTASAADITGDGAPEILAPSTIFDIHAVDRNGREAPNWPKLTGEAVNSTPAVGDFNGDGKLDVAVLTRGGLVWVWSTSGRASNVAPWPKFQHDLKNSGTYPVRK